MYLMLKHAHMLIALVSLLGFVARVVFSFIKTKEQLPKWAKIVPHIVDTLLLILGLTLAIWLGFNPLVHSWLAAKLLLLLGYIGFGIVPLRLAKQWQGKVGFVLALLCFAGMVHFAMSKMAIW